MMWSQTPKGRPRVEIGTAHVLWFVYTYAGGCGDKRGARFVVMFNENGARKMRMFADDFDGAMTFAQDVA